MWTVNKNHNSNYAHVEEEELARAFCQIQFFTFLHISTISKHFILFFGTNYTGHMIECLKWNKFLLRCFSTRKKRIYPISDVHLNGFSRHFSHRFTRSKTKALCSPAFHRRRQQQQHKTKINMDNKRKQHNIPALIRMRVCCEWCWCMWLCLSRALFLRLESLITYLCEQLMIIMIWQFSK